MPPKGWKKDVVKDERVEDLETAEDGFDATPTEAPGVLSHTIAGHCSIEATVKGPDEAE